MKIVSSDLRKNIHLVGILGIPVTITYKKPKVTHILVPFLNRFGVEETKELEINIPKPSIKIDAKRYEKIDIEFLDDISEWYFIFISEAPYDLLSTFSSYDIGFSYSEIIKDLKKKLEQGVLEGYVKKLL